MAWEGRPKIEDDGVDHALLSNVTFLDRPSATPPSPPQPQPPTTTTKAKSRSREADGPGSVKRRCCDGNTPSCAACASVYGTECVYDPNSDHRRKGVYKKDIDNLKTRNSTLQTLIQAVLDYPEEEAFDLVRQIRSAANLDDVADSLQTRENGMDEDEDELESPLDGLDPSADARTFEAELSGKMGELRLEDGSVKYIGGTSNLILLDAVSVPADASSTSSELEQRQREAPLTSWTTVTSDLVLFKHLMNMYFNWHYPYFTTLSKSLFYRDFLLGRPADDTRRKSEYCSPLLVNAMLALGCHFSSWPGARADPEDSATTGDHFFREAKRLLVEDDEHEKPRLATVQALALMSVREAGCGREGKGWVYSGMSFRMAGDLGLNVDSGGLTGHRSDLNDEEIDARRVTFWGCFLFDKCWSNYLGRQPQLPVSNITVPKFDVFPVEDAATWSPYTDAGMIQAYSQPARTRAVALRISSLCEISSDLLIYFYHPTHMDRSGNKSTELKKLSELHTRLEAWRKEMPKEMEPREGALPPVLLMHMFFQLLFIHLFRPFLKYNRSTSPLPPHVSPRKICTSAAQMISKLLRLYKRTYGLRQICNVAVYIAHSACTIHLLNLPEKTAKRDIVHGVKHLQEIAEGWLCARRTLAILNMLAKRWSIEMPDEAAMVLANAEANYGAYVMDELTPRSNHSSPPSHNVNANGAEPSTHSSPDSQVYVSTVQSHGTDGVEPIPPSVGPRSGDNHSTPIPRIVEMATSHPAQRYAAVQSVPQPYFSPPIPGQPHLPHLRLHAPRHSPASSVATIATDTTTAWDPPINGAISPPITSNANAMSIGLPMSSPSHPHPHPHPQPPQPQHMNLASPLVSPPIPISNHNPFAHIIPETHDWWLRDQSALAVGFENWNGFDPTSAPGSAPPMAGSATTHSNGSGGDAVPHGPHTNHANVSSISEGGAATTAPAPAAGIGPAGMEFTMPTEPYAGFESDWFG
ncbi:MAG: hypothetical protein M1838_001752 [Thelocarpon superellum]|nr:MAG: hypothetical protein M1838_001752 [Thelocarpon superellum]